jgi:hypothetical protein
MSVLKSGDIQEQSPTPIGAETKPTFAETKANARDPANWGLFYENSGNLSLRKTVWWGWEDSNF